MSRTHRVGLDWLFDRIDFDSKIQIRYIDSKHQFVEILTKGSFTRDEWNVLLHLFNVSHFSSVCCVKNSSFIGCTTTMAKRTKESEEGKIVAKSKPTVLKLSSCDSASSSSICKRSKNIERPGDPLRLREICRQENQRRVEYLREVERCFFVRIKG